MPLSDSRLAYSDCFDLWAKAQADLKGIRVRFTDYDKALHFRHRMHKARTIERKENREAHDYDHILYGRSEYDGLMVTITREGNIWWLSVVKMTADDLVVESLGGEEEPETVAKEPEPIGELIVERLDRRG